MLPSDQVYLVVQVSCQHVHNCILYTEEFVPVYIVYVISCDINCSYCEHHTAAILKYTSIKSNSKNCDVSRDGNTKKFANKDCE